MKLASGRYDAHYDLLKLTGPISDRSAKFSKTQHSGELLKRAANGGNHQIEIGAGTDLFFANALLQGGSN